MIRNNIKMKNGDCSGDLGTENYCKDTTLVSIATAIKTFGSLDTRDYGICSKIAMLEVINRTSRNLKE